MMSDKKHIDRLFQESLKDFEVTPNDAVWKRIEAKLNQKKHKKRIIPIWWRYAGVAALLAILLTIGGAYIFNDTNNIPPHTVVDTENITPQTDSTPENNAGFSESHSNNTLHETVSQIASEKENNTTENSATASPVLKYAKNKKQHVTPKATPKTLVLQPQTNVAKRVPETPSKTNGSENTSSVSSNPLPDNNTALATHSENDNTISENEAVAQVKNDDTLPEDGISKNLDENILTIEDALANNATNNEEEENVNRWSISPNAAPVYFNTLGHGSTIDPQFENNPKTGEVNMSYGISASYAINRKLSIRSGINRVNLGYNTNNIVRYQSYSAGNNALQNVDASGSNTNQSQENVSLISKDNLNNSQDVPKNFSESNTSINQAFGYIEVPLEFQYALSHKKLGLNIIGGISSFFLNNNKIFSESGDGEKKFLGPATNINKISYSANFGLGFKYQVSKKIDLNLEPMFKYQINTFNNTSGDFKPFIIGTYTGFTIKF